MKNKKLFLTYNPEKKNDEKIKKWIDFLEKNDNFKIVKEAEKSDIVVPIWWDATLLYSIFYYKNLWKPFFPIAWGTRNFLLNNMVNFDELYWDIQEFELWFIKWTAEFIDWTKQDFEAFNDIYLNAKIWWVWYLKISWEKYIEREVVWDWIIASTTQWSTWYNKNAWWVILPLIKNIFSLTDINSTKNISHIIESQKIEIEALRWDFKVSFDMKTFEKIVKKVTLDKSDNIARILFLKTKEFEKFRYTEKNETFY